MESVIKNGKSVLGKRGLKRKESSGGTEREPQKAAKPEPGDGEGALVEGRSRREKEKNCFLALSALLPLSPPIRDHLDRTGVLRVSTAFLQLRRVMANLRDDGAPHASASSSAPTEGTGHGTRNGQSGSTAVEPMRQFAFNLFQVVNGAELALNRGDCVQAMDGFAIVISAAGRVVYVGETVAVHLGLSQIELTGDCLSDFVHPDDAVHLRDQLALFVEGRELRVLEPQMRFTLRFRCAPGRRAMMGCSTPVGLYPGFKPIHFMGAMSADEDGRFVGYGQATAAHGLSEIRLSSGTFVFRSTLALQMMFVDNRMTALTGFSAGTLLDRRFYAFVHPEDVPQVQQTHQNALERGQSPVSAFFRILAAGGGWVWAQCRFCVVASNGMSSLAQLIVAICTVISEVEEGDSVMDLVQTECGRGELLEEPIPQGSGQAGPSAAEEGSCGPIGFYSAKFYGTLAETGEGKGEVKKVANKVGKSCGGSTE